jgi:hypothetical protein
MHRSAAVAAELTAAAGTGKLLLPLFQMFFEEAG